MMAAADRFDEIDALLSRALEVEPAARRSFVAAHCGGDHELRAAVEHHAKSFEQPVEVVKWYYSSPERLQEFESAVIEQNVVDWAMSVARVEDKPTALEDLMGKANA